MVVCVAGLLLQLMCGRGDPWRFAWNRNHIASWEIEKYNWMKQRRARRRMMTRSECMNIQSRAKVQGSLSGEARWVLEVNTDRDIRSSVVLSPEFISKLRSDCACEREKSSKT